MKKFSINNFNISNNGKFIYDFAKKIFPINRSLTGEGNRKTLKLIKIVYSRYF